MRTLTITAAEWASVQDGTLWLVREGIPADPYCKPPCSYHAALPPLEFTLACAPCETCHNTTGSNQQHGEFTRWDLLTCPDCRVELVGPDDWCENCQHVPMRHCRMDHHRIMFGGTLGHAYAVGDPPPFSDYYDESSPEQSIAIAFRDPPAAALLPDGRVLGSRDLAHYGPPESLVGRWALQLAVQP